MLKYNKIIDILGLAGTFDVQLSDHGSSTAAYSTFDSTSDEELYESHNKTNMFTYNKIKNDHVSFFNDPVYYRSVAIDGLCCVGKSSFGNFFREAKMIKPQAGVHYVARNTHPSSCLGYLYSYIKNMDSIGNTEPDKFYMYDRMPINAIMWNNIWRMIGLAMDDDLNDIDSIDDGKRKSLFKLTDYMANNIMNTYGRLGKNIIIIDSDIELAKSRMMARGKGSDVERSSWKNYIQIQNYAYKMLQFRWPNLYYLIDLSDYNGDISSMHKDLKSIIGKLMKTIKLEPSPFTFAPLADTSHVISCGDVEKERYRPIDDCVWVKMHKYSIGDKDNLHFVHINKSTLESGVYQMIVNKNNGVVNVAGWVCMKSGWVYNPNGLLDSLVEKYNAYELGNCRFKITDDRIVDFENSL